MEATLRTVDAEPTFTESAEEQSSPLSRLTLQLQGHLQVVDNNEASRTLVEGMGATLVCQGVESKCQVRDVSIKGIGLLSDHELPKGAELALTVQTDVGTVSAKGVVRHVRAYRGKFRVGVELTTFSRLDASRWKKLIGEAA
jgi:hypothetical protein